MTFSNKKDVISFFLLLLFVHKLQCSQVNPEHSEIPSYLPSYLGNLGIVQKWVKQIDDLNVQDRKGYQADQKVVQEVRSGGVPVDTPLSSAAKTSGALALVQMLLNRRASVYIAAKDTTFPLHKAIASGNAELVSHLLRHGANVQAKTESGWTALHEAAKKGDSNIVRMLVMAKSPVQSKTEEGVTPLHVASASGHRSVVKELLSSGADVDVRDNRRSTPLHWSAFWGNLGAAQELLEHKAEVNSRDGSGKTPLYYAADVGHEPIESLLRSKGGQ